jgi:hypothetical protein
MTLSELISDFALIVEKPYDLEGLWKAKAYDDLVSAYSGLGSRISAASALDKRQLLPELTQRTRDTRGSISTFLCGLTVARLVCAQEDGWVMRPGMLAAPTDETLVRLSKLEESLRDKSSAGALFARALHQFWSGNRVEGFAAFRALGENPDYKALVRDDLRGATTCHPQALAETAATPLPAPELEFISSCRDSTSAIAVATFDDIYFRAFAKRLLETANQARDAKLHFHIINPTLESFQLARELISLGKSRTSSVGISYQHQQIKDRATLACSRFAIMEKLLKHYGRGLLVTDADLFYRRPFGELMQTLDQSRIALAIQSDPRGSGYLPWRAVSAGYLFVPYTEAGLLFSQRVAHAIQRSWQDGSNWWVDQTALYCAFYQFGEKFGADDIVMLPSEIPSALPTSEAYKIKMISEVPEVNAAMRSGMNWNAALHSVQTKPQANPDFSPSLATKIRRSARDLLRRRQAPPPPVRTSPNGNPDNRTVISSRPPVDLAKPVGPMHTYQITADQMDLSNVLVPATIIVQKILDGRICMLRISGGNLLASSAGRTGGLSIRVPDEFESTVSSHRVRVEVVARSAAAGAAKFSTAYSTAEVGNSGWRVFDAGPSFNTHCFEWNVPQMKDGHGDFVGILPQIGDTIDIKSVRVEVLQRDDPVGP